MAHQRFFIFERRAVQIQKTLWIYEEARAEFLENFVAVARLRIQTHRIGQTRAAAALYTNAQASLFGETPSFSRSSRIFFAARSLKEIFAIVGLATSVAIFKCSKGL